MKQRESDSELVHLSAMPLHEAALKTRRVEVGNGHPKTLVSGADMGDLLQSMGKLEEAELYYREAMEGQRRVLGDDHADALTSIGQ